MTPDAFQTVVDLSNERAEQLDGVRAVLRDWSAGKLSPGEALTQISREVDRSSRASEVIIRRPGKHELQSRAVIEQERILLEARLQVILDPYRSEPGEAARVQAGFAALAWVLNDPDPQPAGRLFAALTSR